MRTGTFTFHLYYRDVGGIEAMGARLVWDKEGILIWLPPFLKNNCNNIVMSFTKEIKGKQRKIHGVKNDLYTIITALEQYEFDYIMYSLL